MGAVELFRLGILRDPNTKDNTDIGISIPVTVNRVPRWWMEGAAQTETAQGGYDLWDTSQDMVLRMAAVEDNLLTYDQLHNINVRENLGPELVYNQGYAFTGWLMKNYGIDFNAKVADIYSKGFWLGFEGILKKCTGVDARKLYEQWLTQTENKYLDQAFELAKELNEGEEIKLLSDSEIKKFKPKKDIRYADGLFNFYTKFSLKGKWFSYISKDKLILRRLSKRYEFRQKDLEEHKDVWPVPLILKFDAGYYSFSPDENRIVISKKVTNNMGGFPYYDLYIVDLKGINEIRSEYESKLIWIERSYLSDLMKKKSMKDTTRRYLKKIKAVKSEPLRISWGLRATHPAWSPTGQEIAFTKNEDGQRHLGLMDSDGANIRYIIKMKDGSQCLEPS
jgi:hypothetical protein